MVDNANLIDHIGYINRRKQELEKLDKWKLINNLIIKELELKEYENEMKCDYCNELHDDCQCQK